MDVVMKGRVWVRRSLETSREESTARVVPTIHSIGKVQQAIDPRLRRRATRGGARSIERPGCGSASLPRCPDGVRKTRTERPSVGSGRRSMSPRDSMLFRVLDKLVLSMPILGPNLVLGVPSRSMLSRAYPTLIEMPCRSARAVYSLANLVHPQRSWKSMVSRACIASNVHT